MLPPPAALKKQIESARVIRAWRPCGNSGRGDPGAHAGIHPRKLEFKMGGGNLDEAEAALLVAPDFSAWAFH